MKKKSKVSNTDKPMKSIKKELKKILLEWGSASDLPTIYANQVLISHAGPEFYIVFGEVITPAIEGNLVDDLPDNFPVKPVVKIAVTPEMMIQISEIINNNVSRFITKSNEFMENK